MDEILQKKYLSLLGQLVYMATWTRPDIAYATSSLSTVSKSPKPEHFRLALRVLAYCKGTDNLGLSWKQVDTSDRNQLIVYTDASWATETDYCSQSGAVFLYNGAPIHWLSKRQEFPALSSTEAEIMAGCTALRETLYLRRLLESLGQHQSVTEMRFDAMNAIRFNTNEKVTKRNHHIGARYMRLRHHVQVADITAVFIPTDQQLADLGTKNPTLDQFETLRDVLVTPIFCDKNHSVNGIEARAKSEESGPIWSVLAPAVATTRCWKRIPPLDFTPNDLGMHGNAPKRTRINASDDFGHFKS